MADAIIRCEQLVAGGLPCDFAGAPLELSLLPGQVVSLIGPKYAGKTQWLRSICGLDEQLDGEIYIDGTNTRDMDADGWALSRTRVAYLRADTALLSAANGLMNVLIPALYHQRDLVPGKGLIAERALETLEEIDPELNLDDLPAYISKEQQFKIAVARAMLLEPGALVLDNPFTHFDIDTKPRFQSYLRKKVDQGLSLLTITHDIDFVCSDSDSIIFVDSDQLHTFNSTQMLLDSHIPAVRDYVRLQGATAQELES